MDTPELLAIYSPTYSDRTKFPLEVRQLLDKYLTDQVLALQASAQSKGKFLDELTRKVDAFEESNPQLVENFGHYRDLFKRKKTALYDVLVSSLRQEPHNNQPPNELATALVSAIEETVLQSNDSQQQLTARDESEELVDNSMEGVESTSNKLPVQKKSAYIPLSRTLDALDKLVKSNKMQTK